MTIQDIQSLAEAHGLLLTDKMNFNEMGIDFTLFKPVYTLRQSAVYIVMSKATPTHTVKLWQDAFEQLTQSGEIKKISLAWQQKLKQEFNISSEISKGILFF